MSYDHERLTQLQARLDGSTAMVGQVSSALLTEALAEATGKACSHCEFGRLANGRCVACGHEPSPWPAPTPLPEGLPSVVPFDHELLPDSLREFVADIAERMQCPVDYPAVATISVLSAVVGRRLGIRPKKLDSWTVIPNLWAMVIGRPGIMKSPPLQEVMRPLNQLQAEAISRHEQAMQEFIAAGVLAGEATKVAKDAIRRALKKGDRAEAAEQAEHLVAAEQQEPVCRRYVVNDATVEKLGELLKENPQGLLHFRDELTGFFRTLERQGHEADRAFFLECWNGDGSFTYDRIGRGTQHIPAACLAMLGSIQPGPLADLIRGMRGGGDDGLLQRFQLSVWPDPATSWSNVDRTPNQTARSKLDALVRRLDGMNAEHLTSDAGGFCQFWQFSTEAQPLFDAWRESLEIRLRNGSEHPMMEAHLAKFRSLIPSLALLLHLADHDDGPVELLALERAIGWADYLESHARRIYAPAITPDLDAARLLSEKIAAGVIAERFALRDVYRNGWTGLATVESTTAACSVLLDFDHLRVDQEQTPGRTRTVYLVNPALLPREPQR